MLRTWDHLPIIRRGLERTRTMMLNAGIPVNDSSTSNQMEDYGIAFSGNRDILQT
jgi:hypothetical protein